MCVKLDLVLPALGPGGGGALPAELEQLITAEAGFQMVRGLNLGDLLVPGFLDDYVRKGQSDSGESRAKGRGIGRRID